MYYVYLIRNRTEGITYIGYTQNPERRLKEHKHKDPDLIYCEVYKDKLDAQERERKLKQRGQTARRLKERIRRSLEQ